MDFATIIILLIAGVLAGVITGLVGASAAIIMAPILILILKMDPYIAIGLSLGTDVVASIVAGRIYYKNKNVSLNPILFLILFSFAGIVLGSYVSTLLPSNDLSGITGIAILLTGFAFMLNKKENSNKSSFLEKFRLKFKKHQIIWLSIIGFLIGLDVGIFGTGGGVVMLFVLVFILDYEMHVAIGTAIIVMILMAFSAGVSHYYFQPFSLIFLLIAAIGGFFGARYSSIFANNISENKLKKIVGIILIILGILLTTKIFFW